MIGAVTNHLWQSTLFVLAAGIVAAALRKNGAHVRHRVWLVASLKFLVPFAVLISLGSSLPTFTTAPASAISTPSAQDLSVVVEQIAQPFASDVVVSSMPAGVSATTRWTVIIFAGTWACGFLVVVVMRLRGWRRIRAAVRASVPVPIDVPVPVRASAGLLEPGVVGLFSPVLLVPIGIEQTLTSKQLEAVLAHELCHVRRRDNLTSAIHMVVEAAFWFHPLVWFVGARLVDERERACDEHVLRVCGEPQAYAESILNVCKLYVESPIACVSGVGGSDLRKRVAAILVNRVGLQLSLVRKVTLAIAAVLVIVLPLGVGMLIAPLGAQSSSVNGAATTAQFPKFDVVSVKPCDPNAPSPGRGGSAGTASPGRLRIDCQSVFSLIHTAYLVYAGGRVNAPPTYPMLEPDISSPKAPDWMRMVRFTLEATTETTPPPVTAVMQGPMLQAVLEDRFKLKMHREMRGMPISELVVAKGGAKVKPFKPGACVPYDWTVSPQPPLEAGQRRCQNSTERDPSGAQWVETAEATTLDEVAAMMGSGGDRTSVVNKTGITGLVAFRLVYTDHDSLVAGLKDQLGLELRPAKGSRDFLVIDHVERPTPNDPVVASVRAPSR